QAMNTFRIIQPEAHLGKYTGLERSISAELVFASVQTLSRKEHLENFETNEFDYIIIDEFHHAAARTYRKIIDYFEPKFLLGLTATPERTDGGDLLGLCGENLVYSCDMSRGIELGLLSPFHYFGVPDEVDYTNIPWRSTRFDPKALENALATQARAENALEQWREKGGPESRTLAFCCSMSHADYMADYFTKAGVRSVAVHSGAQSSPRASSIEKLKKGDLDVVFAVDIFNEGVDIPNIDTILMLRPTESRILWLQQFGRGLRKFENKPRLNVVDYIGNHRVFLNKPVALLGLSGNHREIQQALEQLENEEYELPPGCNVTYDLTSIDILRGLLRIPNSEGALSLRDWYVEFRERTGRRPRAIESFHEGYNLRIAQRRYGSWHGLVGEEGDLSENEITIRDTTAWQFLLQLENTPMTKSFKILVLLAMLNNDKLP
ncbi:MAG: DEAD/DEAH box helicase, partial [Candidatus Peribacteraceae bacterium]|nr:DEAD/DEAH box helicase [Candidatus Peribacteraceae bacterium]